MPYRVVQRVTVLLSLYQVSAVCCLAGELQVPAQLAAELLQVADLPPQHQTVRTGLKMPWNIIRGGGAADLQRTRL